ncbi:LysR family transcriptional regulator [Marinobacter fuscus]|uniref:LysR family transcriptional regulator n=1 Tax=Marinobacter fuscus TaxID=2109942 RepID=A0A2T1KQK3_9GAMM|nr:LysR family transcriptional regulator [Marinobacter fuscus]PSF11953.1 LysR family transcriptional regulator [Marinobacter fuscus]
MALTLKQLRYFVVLSEELHFGRAADRLHISQPPLSTSLRQLEGVLGVQLLERNSKCVALTPAGKLFQRQARLLLGQLDDAQDMLRRTAESDYEVLRIGSTPAMIYRGLPPLLSEFKDLYPGIGIQLFEQYSLDQVESLCRGRIDIGFINSIPLPAEVDSLPIGVDEFVCCLPANHPLAQRDVIELTDIDREPLVMLNSALAPHFHQHFHNIFRAKNFELNVKHEASHWQTVVALTSYGLGISLVPQSLELSGMNNVRFVPLAGVDTRYTSCCIWRRDSTSLGRDFLLACIRSRLERKQFS